MATETERAGASRRKRGPLQKPVPLLAQEEKALTAATLTGQRKTGNRDKAADTALGLGSAAGTEGVRLAALQSAFEEFSLIHSAPYASLRLTARRY
jgi:hypothetical protein